MDYLIPPAPLVQGLVVPMITALDAEGRFDPVSQERLVAYLAQGEAGAGALALFSNGTSGEWSRLDAAVRLKVTECAHYGLAGGRGPRLWAGINDKAAGVVVANLEHALKLGASAAVLAPLAVEDVRDVGALFHRHISPLYQRLGKGLPLFLYDNPDVYRRGRQDRLRTREVKQLARLDYVCGVKVTADARAAGNYLKGARNHKARHEFGIYLGRALQAFPFFTPSRGPVGNLRERWRRFWVAPEAPQGVVPLSGNLFPSAWRRAWDACVAGDLVRMDAFRDVLGRLEEAFVYGGVFLGVACVKAALAEEGLLASPRLAAGGQALGAEEHSRWMRAYGRAKSELAALCAQAAAQASGPGAPAAGPPPRIAAVRPGPADRPGPAQDTPGVLGFGAAVVDGITPVRALIGSDGKQKTLGPAQRHPGGVVFNQLAWLRALGLRAALAGGSGSGEGAAYLRSEARRLGVDCSAWQPMPGVDADVARIFAARSGRGVYLEPGASTKQGPEQVRLLKPALERAQFLVTEISLLPLASVEAALRLAKDSGKESFLDLDVEPDLATGAQGLGSAAALKRCLGLAFHVKASLEAARRLAPRAKDAGLAAAIHKALKKAPGQWVTVTAGSRGAWAHDGVKAQARKAYRVAAKDTTGCGDAFHAGLICGRAAGLPLDRALALACAAGAVAATHSGAVPLEGAAQAVAARLGRALPWPVTPPGQGSRSEGGEHLRVALAELKALATGYPLEKLDEACALILDAEGKGRRVHVTGVGKCEHVASYIASSFSSTGTPAFFLHATEAGHGASGQVAAGDVVIAISNSGETAELRAAVGTLRRNGARILGVSGRAGSWLARHCESFLWAGVRREGDALNLAPRNSVLAEILVLNALGVALQHSKKFTAEQFRAFHPGGSLGKTDED
jgi:arabinose-5-phosphate isomerase